MNGLVIVLIGIVVLFAGYLFYGRWLAKKWGLDPKAETPAVKYEDGELIPMQRHLRIHTRTDRIMCRHLSLRYFPINFHPLQVQAL